MEAERHEGRWQTRPRGRPRLILRPLSRTGENPPYGILGEAMETSSSSEARSAPLSHPTASSARTDLCGGRSAMIVPTATLIHCSRFRGLLNHDVKGGTLSAPKWGPRKFEVA